MTFDNEKLIGTLCRIAIEAGNTIMQIYQRDFCVEYKKDASPVTEADKAADRYINENLAAFFPEIARLSEETTDNISRRENDLCFITDPLDGTKEFVKKNGEFTVNIGLSYKEKAVAGVIYAPTTGVLYYALKGKGSFRSTKEMNDPLFSEKERLSVSGRTKDIIFMQSRSHPDKQTQEIIEKNEGRISKIIQSGSSIKGCMIASGEGDVYYRFGPTYEWDTCAMQAVVENAGGIFLQGDLSEMTYNRENTLNAKGFIIANRRENIWQTN